MADRFREKYGPHFEKLEREGRLADADPMVAVMVATRWLFYFFTVEKCFGAPLHFGMTPRQAVDGFIQMLRYGLLPRPATSRKISKSTERRAAARPASKAVRKARRSRPSGGSK